jgi:hypothetical protein
MPETNMPIDPNAARIGTTERHCLSHFFDDGLLCLDIATVADPTGYTAHRLILSKMQSAASRDRKRMVIRIELGECNTKSEAAIARSRGPPACRKLKMSGYRTIWRLLQP